MRTIWKYELRIETQQIQMPKGAKLLSASGQYVEERGNGFARAGTYPMLWALVDPHAPMVTRLIDVVGTGQPLASVADFVGDYVGTAICGHFVWHVIDCGELDS